MRATGLVLFLLLLAGLLLLLVQGPGTGPATSGGPAAAGPSGEGTESAPRVGEAGGSTPHRIQDRPQDPPRPAPVTVTGLVTGEGRPLTGARVFLHRAGGEPPPEKSDLRPSTADPLASTRTDAAGRYTLHLEAGVVPGTFDLGAWAPGWRRRLELDVPISAKGSRWDLLLTRGLVLAGRVVDPEGKPVAGMPLFACSHPDKWPSYFLGRPGRRESDNLVVRISAFLVQSATTGPEGRFRFTGLEDRIYHFFTGRLGLALREPRSARAGGEGLELVAAPCYGLRVAVTDAGTGKPLDLAMCRIHIFHHDRCVRSTHISTSREVLDKWAPPPDPAGRVEYHLRFSAPRYIARNLSLKPPAGQLHATGRVALTRMEPEKGYPFLYRCRYVDGTPARIPLHLELRDEEGERVYSRTMEPRTPGTYQCRLPPGKWKVSVAPSVGLFGPMPAERNGPYGPKHISIQKATFEGTSRERRSASSELMEAITSEDVCEACDTILHREAWRAA